MAEIKHQIPIKASPQKVYAALGTQTGLRGWWTADSNADQTAGGKAEFGFDKRGMVFRMNVHYVQTNEPGTQMYLAWQEESDPTRFLHLFIFAEEASQARHGQSEAVRRFESVYSPELVGGEVVFTIET
jgi:uncharacterized protein YndB with AHSA1/START domain